MNKKVRSTFRPRAHRVHSSCRRLCARCERELNFRGYTVPGLSGRVCLECYQKYRLPGVDAPQSGG